MPEDASSSASAPASAPSPENEDSKNTAPSTSEKNMRQDNEDAADNDIGAEDTSDDASESTAPPDDSPSLCEDLYGDDTSDMTYGRRIARYLSRYSWYYPYRKHEEKFREAAAAARQLDGDFEPVNSNADGTRSHQEHCDKPEHISFRDGDVKPPSLDAAWAYFEHSVLPRHFVRPEDVASASAGPTSTSSSETGVRGPLTKAASVFTMNLQSTNDKYQRAEPGETERPTALYPIWDTPEEQLADFGVGVGLYFNSLKVLAIILAIAGLICIPAMQFYSSSEYSANQQAGLFEGGLSGSAICTDARWVACPTCQPDDWQTSFPAVGDRYAFIENSDGTRLNFIKRNFCQVRLHPGLFLFIALLFLTVTFYFYGVATRRKEVEFDEAQQTTTDYSVEVMHPPKDARDPTEWKHFFEKASGGGHVTVCTIALDNEELVRALLTRRMKLMHLEMMLPSAMKLARRSKLKEQIDTMPPMSWWKRLYMSGMHMAFSPKMVYSQILALEKRIEELSKKVYDVSHVFVTFETEHAQRKALMALDTPFQNVKKNNLQAIPEELRFRGKHVLWIQEPAEPDAVRWQDLEETKLQRLKQQSATLFLTLLCVGGGGAIIAAARRRSAAAAAIVIIILNSGVPQVVKQIIKFESHCDEGSRQRSLYVKMTLLRWFNTAIITTVISPFTDMISNGPDYLLQSIYAIFFAELIKTPILQMTDYMSQVKRHLFGPRLIDRRFRQEQFAGSYWTLAERLTDATKIVFLTLYYATIFPAAFFFAAGTLVIHYWTDKWCILRCWARAPQIGTDLSKFSRFYVYPLTILAFALSLAYNYGSFPFDNACELEELVDGSYVLTNATATTLDGKQVTVTIEEGDPAYRYCYQNLLKIKPAAFPPLPADQRGNMWMTDGQEKMLIIIGWTFVAILIWVCFIFFSRIVLSYFRTMFAKTYKPSGRATDLRFSDLPEIYGYVPQVKLFGSNYPALICDISTIDENLIGWIDPAYSYDRHNMIFDVPGVRQKVMKHRQSLMRSASRDGEEEKGRKASIFSIVCDWPPAPEENEDEELHFDTKMDEKAEDEGI